MFTVHTLDRSYYLIIYLLYKNHCHLRLCDQYVHGNLNTGQSYEKEMKKKLCNENYMTQEITSKY